MGDEFDDNDDNYDGDDGGDSYSETSERGLGSRLMDSIKSVGIGILLFIISFPVLWCNEGRAIKTARGLTEGAGAVKTVEAATVNSAMNGKLIHVTADAKTDDTIADSELGISAQAIKLMRSVDMYQWKEVVKTKKEKKVGGKEVTKKTYKYKKEWSSSFIDSNNFKVAKYRGQNPAMKYKSSDWVAQNVTAGAYKLTPTLIKMMTSSEKLAITPELLAKMSAEVKGSAKLDGEYIYIGKGSMVEPKVGDLRIAYSVVKPQTVSVVGKQNGQTFEPYYTKENTQIYMLVAGTVSAQNMFTQAQEANKSMTWIIRLIGFLLMAIGLGMIFQPIVTLADVLPFLGDILRLGIGIFAGIAAFALSFVTIAIAWIAYRPMLGIGLLVIGVGVVVGVKYMAKKKK